MIGDIQGGGVQSAFIPKKPFVSSGTKERAGLSAILNFISVIVFVAAISVYGGAWFYRTTLNSSIASINADISKIQKELQGKDSIMKEMIRFDTKLKTLGFLLDNHTSLQNLFKFLEEETMKNVRYSEFGYSFGGNNTIDIRLAGEAESYSTIALQAQNFVDSKRSGDRDFSGIIFSDFNPSATGNVVFKATAKIAPDLVFYKNLDSIKSAL